MPKPVYMFAVIYVPRTWLYYDKLAGTLATPAAAIQMLAGRFRRWTRRLRRKRFRLGYA